MRKLLGTLAAAAIAAVGVVGMIAFFNSRDDSTTASDRRPPGQTRPAGDSSLLEAGNVVLRFSDPAFEAPLRELASELGAPDRPELRAVGQAVVLQRTRGTSGIVATAHRRRLAVPGPDDLRLQAFVERWLGRGASG